jgi:hypothetical protein
MCCVVWAVSLELRQEQESVVLSGQYNLNCQEHECVVWSGQYHLNCVRNTNVLCCLGSIT